MSFSLQNLPIRRKLVAIILGICGVALLLTCSAFFAYEYFTFRQEMVRHISTLGDVVATNSTAALDFDNPTDATDILRAFKADKHIVAAALFDREGKRFAHYPSDRAETLLPARPDPDGYRFVNSRLVAFLPVREGNRRIGTLHIESDLDAMHERFRRYGVIVALVATVSVGLAYILSQIMQKQISGPILALADTARAISERQDFSVRATGQGRDELGLMTEAFNQMLDQIQLRDGSLRASEVRFRSLVTATAQIVWSTDPQGRVTGPLPSWQAYTGQNDATVQGAGWASALHPEDSARALEVWTKAVESKGSYDVDYRIRRHDGEYRYFTARGVPVLNDDGSIREWVGTCTDIHDRRMAEAARSRLAAIVESAEDAILSRDLNGTVQSWNPGAEHLFGYKAEEIVGRNIVLLVPADRAREEQHFTAKMLLGERINQFETVRQRKDGTTVDVMVTVSPLKDDTGRVIGAAKILRDITDRKMAEKKLQANAEDLRRSNEELERFAYVASHDLQEPLRTVASFAQLLGKRFKGKLDNDADEFIQFIVDGANRMQTLINDLLSFSRVGTKGKPFAPVATEDVVKTVLHDLNGSIADHGAEVTHDALPVVMADGVQVRQVLQNLIGNAIKFHKKGEPPRVHISAAPQNGQWEFRVRDSGIGIDPQYFERVFIIFQRLHGKEEYSGTGIGLAVCKKIVERHAGRIWVESEPGVGSTFCFTLPGANDHS